MQSQTRTESQAWIIVANRINMERCAKHGVFGLNKPGLLAKMAKGDHIVAYIKGEKVFAGIGRVTKGHFLDNEKVFDGGLYPDRISIELKLVPHGQEVNVWDIVDDLEFPSDKINWHASLIGGIRRIPIKDFELIQRKLGANALVK